MQHFFSSKRRSAFTLIELMVVIAVIVILAGAAYVNYTRVKLRARDTNRKVGAESYAGAVQLYGQANNGSYLIRDKTSSNKAGSGLGYNAEGQGRITAKSTNGAVTSGYGTTSIADGLFAQGFLAEVKTPPTISDLSAELGRPALALDTFHDYLLAVCDKSGSRASLTGGVSGDEYAVYTYLEVPVASEVSAIASKCGGPESVNFWLQSPMATGNL